MLVHEAKPQLSSVAIWRRDHTTSNTVLHNLILKSPENPQIKAAKPAGDTKCCLRGDRYFSDTVMGRKHEGTGHAAWQVSAEQNIEEKNGV